MKAKKGKPMNGQELRGAAQKGLPLYYVEEYFDPHDKGLEFHGITKLEKAPHGYYIGNSDIDPDDFEDFQVVRGDFPEGQFFVYCLDGIVYAESAVKHD